MQSIQPGFRVLFIDYGNWANTTHLCELPTELVTMPRMALHFALAAVPSTDENNDATTTTTSTTVVDDANVLSAQQFAELNASEEPFYFDVVDDEATSSATTATDDSKPCRVRMYRDAERRHEIRIQPATTATAIATATETEALADTTTTEDVVDDADDITLVEPAEQSVVSPHTDRPDLSSSTAFPHDPLVVNAYFAGAVCWTTSSSEFYVQPTHLQPLLEQVLKSLTLAPSFGRQSDAQVGDICAAEFAEDGSYYRAQIVSIVGEGEQKGESEVFRWFVVFFFTCVFFCVQNTPSALLTTATMRWSATFGGCPTRWV